MTDTEHSDLKRTYRCPQCDYAGFRSSGLKVSGGIEANVQYGCPRCMTVDGLVVLLEETSDPRDVG